MSLETFPLRHNTSNDFLSLVRTGTRKQLRIQKNEDEKYPACYRVEDQFF